MIDCPVCKWKSIKKRTHVTRVWYECKHCDSSFSQKTYKKYIDVPSRR